MECSICCEKYNKSSRKAVGCGCGIEVCRECAERYLLDSATNPQCMGCRRQWDNAFLSENFTKVFVSKTLKEHRENVLFDREKAMLPEAQPLAEVTKVLNAITEEIRVSSEKVAENEFLFRERMAEVNGLRCQLHTENRLLADIGEYVNAIKSLKEIKEVLFKEKANVELQKELQKTLRNVMDPNYIGGGGGTSDFAQPAQVRRFVRACPADGCRGFLSEQWKCGLCEVRVCAKCHEIKVAGGDDAPAVDPSAPGPSQPAAGGGSGAAAHVCKEENLASAAMIAKDSRPCPSCAAMIHRVSGCEQMWCVCCKTAFNWRTGVVDKGVVHNPEYMRYMRERAARTPAAELPRAEGDVPCGRANIRGERELPSQVAFYDRLRKKLKMIATPAGQKLMNIYVNFSHNYYAIRRRFGEVVAPEARNRDIRIKFLLKDIDEASFKRLLHQREKAEAKKRDYREALFTYQNIIADYVALVHVAETAKAADDLAVEMEQLRIFTNDLLGQIANRYNAVKPEINSYFRLESL